MENFEKVINNPYFVKCIAIPTVSKILEVIKGETSAFDIYIKNRQIFISELEKNSNNVKISPKIDENEVIRRTIATAQIIPRTREEKLKYFARLLQHSISEEEYIGADEFDEYSKILDELSVREMQILCIFNDYLKKFPGKAGTNEIDNGFWDKFISDLNLKFNLNNDKISAILTRMQRTGCVESLKGVYCNSAEMFKLTPVFKELANIAKIKYTDFDKDADTGKIATGCTNGQSSPRNDGG